MFPILIAYLIKNFADLEVRANNGALAVNLVFCCLKSMVGDTGIMHFWRTTAKAEGVFVVEMPDRLIPVE